MYCLFMKQKFRAIGYKIEMAMLKAEMDRDELIKKTGLSRGTVEGMINNPQRTFKLKSAKSVAKALRMETSEIFLPGISTEVLTTEV